MAPVCVSGCRECSGCMACGGVPAGVWEREEALYACELCGTPIFKGDVYLSLGEERFCEGCGDSGRRVA